MESGTGQWLPPLAASSCGKVKVGPAVESRDANQLFSWNKSRWVFTKNAELIYNFN